MDLRKTISNRIDTVKSPYLLLELATGTGKSKLALNVMKERCTVNSRILIVVPRLLLIDNWKKEIAKWNLEEYNKAIEYVTYVSFPKAANEYDLIIFDEVHHLSERCRNSLNDFIIHNAVLLSATVSRDLKFNLKYYFNGIEIIKVKTREAIDANTLPDPKVYLIPLYLDNRNPKYSIIKNPTKGNPIVIPFKDRWKHREKNRRIIIKCTQKEYYQDISSAIDWYKKKVYMPAMKNIWLHKCGDRLKWLSSQKTSFVSSLLDGLKKERTLTFCNSIEQTELLGKYYINSNNPKSSEYLDLFNNGKINHITACAMLDEGQNLSDCRIGVYANLSASDRLITQRQGRILRHKDPILIIPYYKGTRDEEIVMKMCEDYNPKLIKHINNINEIKL